MQHLLLSGAVVCLLQTHPGNMSATSMQLVSGSAVEAHLRAIGDLALVSSNGGQDCLLPGLSLAKARHNVYLKTVSKRTLGREDVLLRKNAITIQIWFDLMTWRMLNPAGQGLSISSYFNALWLNALQQIAVDWQCAMELVAQSLPRGQRWKRKPTGIVKVKIGSNTVRNLWKSLPFRVGLVLYGFVRSQSTLHCKWLHPRHGKELYVRYIYIYIIYIYIYIYYSIIFDYIWLYLIIFGYFRFHHRFQIIILIILILSHSPSPFLSSRLVLKIVS